MSQSSAVQASSFDHELSYFRFWTLRGSDQAVKSPDASVSDTESISPHTTRPSTARRPLPRRSALSSIYHHSSIGPANASKEHLEPDSESCSRNGDLVEVSTLSSPAKSRRDEEEMPKAARVLDTPNPMSLRPSNALQRNQFGSLKKPYLPRRQACYAEPTGRIIHESVNQEQELPTAPVASQSKHQITLPFCTISFGKPVYLADKYKQTTPTITLADITNGTDETNQGGKPVTSPAHHLMHETEPVSQLVRMIRLLGSKTKSVQALKRVQTILQSQIPVNPPPRRVDTSDRIGNLLHHVSTALRNLPELWQAPDDASSRSDSSHRSDRSIASGTAYYRSSRNPRSRRHFVHYHNNSQSNSFLEHTLHRRRQVTPDSGAMYLGSDGQQHLKVDITNPNGPTYLPSEARRVQTPPLNEFEGPNKRRGFFFDYNRADDSKATSPRAFNPRPTARRLYGGANKDWYAALEAALEEEDDTRQPEVDVPDHLPSSLLCPRHPKHKSGGTGVCPVHGRNNSVVSTRT